MTLRTLIPIAVVATAAALLLRRHRWLHDLHVALGVRALRLEGELARARADMMAISELAANALHSEMRLSFQLDRAAERIQVLERALAALREPAEQPPAGEMAVDGVLDEPVFDRRQLRCNRSGCPLWVTCDDGDIAYCSEQRRIDVEEDHA